MSAQCVLASKEVLSGLIPAVQKGGLSIVSVSLSTPFLATLEPSNSGRWKGRPHEYTNEEQTTIKNASEVGKLSDSPSAMICPPRDKQLVSTVNIPEDQCMKIPSYGAHTAGSPTEDQALYDLTSDGGPPLLHLLRGIHLS